MMKTLLRVFGILLLALCTIAMSECDISGEKSTNYLTSEEKKLAGTYRLKGHTKFKNASGTLSLNSDSSYTYNLTVPVPPMKESFKGTWNIPINTAFDEDVLVLERDDALDKYYKYTYAGTSSFGTLFLFESGVAATTWTK